MAERKSTTAKSRAARSEQSQKARTLEFEDLTLTLPKKVPFPALRHMREDVGPQEIVGLINDILGPEESAKVWEADLDIEQGAELLQKVLEEMGLSQGEASASPNS